MVEQVDRDAAADAFDRYWPTNKNHTGKRIREGKLDHFDEVQAFKRHRIAAEARGMEKAATEIARLVGEVNYLTDMLDAQDNRAALKGNQ